MALIKSCLASGSSSKTLTMHFGALDNSGILSYIVIDKSFLDGYTQATMHVTEGTANSLVRNTITGSVTWSAIDTALTGGSEIAVTDNTPFSIDSTKDLVIGSRNQRAVVQIVLE